MSAREPFFESDAMKALLSVLVASCIAAPALAGKERLPPGTYTMITVGEIHEGCRVVAHGTAQTDEQLMLAKQCGRAITDYLYDKGLASFRERPFIQCAAKLIRDYSDQEAMVGDALDAMFELVCVEPPALVVE